MNLLETVPGVGRLSPFLFACIVACCSNHGVAAQDPIREVTRGGNAGEGTLRAALEDGAGQIVVTTDEDIHITEPLVYEGEQALSIRGAGQTVKANDDFTLLEISNGADLSVTGLDFEGPGGFDIENQAQAGSLAGKGIAVTLRENQLGTVELRLRDVNIRGVANHGVHVSDCDLADDCGGGGSGTGNGSDASIQVEFDEVTIEAVGRGKFDADGLRVDERGVGGILFRAKDSSFVGVGADGVELDEGQQGGVRAIISRSVFRDNGAYCDPVLLGQQLQAWLDGLASEAQFRADEQVAENDIPGAVTGTLDDLCFERELEFHRGGSVAAYEISIDVDDGFDVDEAGPGSIEIEVEDVTISGNLDAGIDLDESGDGAGLLVLRRARILDSIEAKGIEVQEH